MIFDYIILMYVMSAAPGQIVSYYELILVCIVANYDNHKTFLPKQKRV